MVEKSKIEKKEKEKGKLKQNQKGKFNRKDWNWGTENAYHASLFYMQYICIV